MKISHLYTTEAKMKWFGPGEWVDEPDEATFEHESFECRVLRVISAEINSETFGGHFCGYVKIPKGHPWHGKRYDDIDCACHGGLTFCDFQRFENPNDFWIGFDCGHVGSDVIPSIGKLIKEDCPPVFNNFQETYRTFDYVIEQTKSLASQATEAIAEENQ